MNKKYLLLAALPILLISCEGTDRHTKQTTRTSTTEKQEGRSADRSVPAVSSDRSVQRSDTTTDRTVAPDNTGRNIRDRNRDALTSGSQSESEADRRITQKIRQELVTDQALSQNAKNIKVITINGVVTLRGVVDNAREKDIIARKSEMSGVSRVDNQLEVKEATKQ